MTRYRCSICQTVSEHPTSDDTPVCNVTSACGLLFEDEVVRVPAPPKRLVSFRLIGGSADLLRGDERHYDVLHRGVVIGSISRVPGLLVDPGDESRGYHPDPFSFTSTDGSMTGEGTTRYAAVAAAFEGSDR